MLKQRCHRGVLDAVEGPLVFPDHDRVPAAVRVGQRRDQGRGLRAARPGQRPAVAGAQKNSATIRPCPANSAAAWSRCRARDVTGSCQSSVETRP